MKKERIVCIIHKDMWYIVKVIPVIVISMPPSVFTYCFICINEFTTNLQIAEYSTSLLFLVLRYANYKRISFTYIHLSSNNLNYYMYQYTVCLYTNKMIKKITKQN